jgi:cytoskeletal protein RodZ
MSQVGKRFREARESRGLSIAQASADIRIQQQSLVDLEEGAYHRLPNSVVTKGFIRNYAQYLELPADELIQMYRAEQGHTAPVAIKPVTKVPRTRSYVLPSFFGVFFVTIALVGLAYVALNAVGVVGNPPIVNAPETATVATPTSLATSASDVIAESVTRPILFTPTPRAVEEPTPDTPAEATTAPSPQIAGGQSTPIPINGATPVPSPTQEAPIVVEVRALAEDSEGSWVRAVTDGSIAYEQVMLPGEQQVFLAQRQVQMRFGNPTAIQVRVNGLEPEIIGGVPGVPVDWSWPPR